MKYLFNATFIVESCVEANSLEEALDKYLNTPEFRIKEIPLDSWCWTEVFNEHGDNIHTIP